MSQKDITLGILPKTQQPTTALNLENVAVAEPDPVGLAPSRLNKHSVASTASIYSYISDDNEDQELLNIFHELMVNEDYVQQAQSENNATSFLDYNIYNQVEPLGRNEFLKKYIAIDKLSDSKTFHSKTKHFFILSSAGKPIYSMNGSDDIIIGYMGLITTIVSTFEEKMKEDFKSIRYGSDLKISILNRDPLLFASISKIKHELTPPTEDNEDDSLVLKQLLTIYNYFLSVLSKSAIAKNFLNRLNFDLRKILTPLDFSNLDMLCLKLSYGVFVPLSFEDSEPGLDMFVSELLGSCLQSVKITNTSRQKLNSILLSCKKLKVKTENDETSILQNVTKLTDDKYLGQDLLFSFILTDINKVIASMRPKNHILSNEDVKTMIFMIESLTKTRSSNESEDLWFPLCMPNFNSSGFLYVFIKQFDLAEYVAVDGLEMTPQPITILLISGNKNSFFEMQQISEHLIHKIVNNESFRVKLSRELAVSTNLSIAKEMQATNVKHFIYKLKLHNQFIMSDISRFSQSDSKIQEIDNILQFTHFYSTLYNSKTTAAKLLKDKKLSYMKWTIDDSHYVTGFMLSDNEHELYCLCNELVPSKSLIQDSVRIIKWCSKYKKRLFISSGAVF